MLVIVTSKAPQRMSRRISKLHPQLAQHFSYLLALWFAFYLCQSYAGLNSATNSPAVPLQAELVAGFDARLLTANQPVFAKARERWSSGDCVLRKDALVKGKVVTASVHSGKSPSEVALLFESAECGGPGLKPLPLVLEAIVGPDSEAGRDTYVPLNQAIGLAPNPGGGIRGAGTAASIAMAEPDFGRPAVKIRSGTVSGISHMKLQVGNGPEGSSVLSMTGRNLQLEAHTVLIFMRSPSVDVNVREQPQPTAAVVIPASPAAPNEHAPILDETEVCTPPMCNVALPSREGRDTGPQTSLSLAEFGFLMRPRQEMTSLNHDAAIAWLGPQELLITFNPHALVPRGVRDGDQAGRTIRALLVDLPTLQVKRVVEWPVPDRRQYIWPAGQGRVIVHVGRELWIYGPGLRRETTLPLDEPLAFVRLSPSNNHLAIGLQQERHTREIHNQLEEAAGTEPEEDIEIRVLDEHYQEVARTTRPSKYAPPTLLDDGEVTFRATAKQQFRMIEVGWDQRLHTIANLRSVCVPEVTSLPGDLLFLVSCDSSTDGKRYRIVRPTGKVMLKGFTSSQTIADLAAGNDAHSAFVIGEANLERALTPGTVFVSGDLKSEQLAVYRNDDGKRLFATTIAEPPPSCQGFALSPDGDRLAALAQGRLMLFHMR